VAGPSAPATMDQLSHDLRARSDGAQRTRGYGSYQRSGGGVSRVTLALGCLTVALAAQAQAQTQPLQQQTVQLSALGGWGFGGSVRDVALDQERSFKAAPVLGGALDVKVAPGWNAELLYSRQETKLAGGLSPSVDVTIERYLLGIQEEKGDERVRWFGTVLLGGTRFVPRRDAFDPEARLTGGLGLGLKAFLTKNVGLRFEARGFYTRVKNEGGTLCANGTCLFAFTGSGVWQGDVGGGVVLAF